MKTRIFESGFLIPPKKKNRSDHPTGRIPTTEIIEKEGKNACCALRLTKTDLSRMKARGLGKMQEKQPIQNPD